MAAGELLGEVTLRNRRQVYGTGSGFRVIQEGRHGEENSMVISARVVEFLADRLSGREIWVEDAVNALQNNRQRLNLPFGYGFKLRFYAQDVLIILVVLGRAEMWQEGRRFIYQIHE